jgi:tetratricopeptide (TPR) repeat protein
MAGWYAARWVFPLLLIAGIFLAYQPAWHAGFIWDDDAYVTNNPLLTAPDGLRRIWFSLDSPSQYFPLVYTTFRLEHALWGFNATGYHCVNILLHGVNAVLLWHLLRRLEVPGAWIGATIFGLHPVQVESVAWVTELKNVEMGFFYLLALLAWVRFDERGRRARWYYALSLALYALALCSKTTACTFPFAVLLIGWLRHGRAGWREMVEVVPHILLGVGMGLVTMWWERYHQGTYGSLFAVSIPVRVLIASRAIWFYLGKLLWPAGLTFSYPHWTISASDPAAYLWMAGVGILGLLAWIARRRMGPGVCVAFAYFGLTLAPVLGFVMLYTFRYTFVADHYQYLACIGPIALVSAGLETAWRKYAIALPGLMPCVTFAILAIITSMTWWQASIYHDPETLWRETLARNPDSILAHNDLGIIRFMQGRLDEAAAESEAALRINPNLAEAHGNLANVLMRQGRTGDAIAEFRLAAQLDPTLPQTHFDLGNALYGAGRTDEAMAQFRIAVRMDPVYADAYYNLGVVEYSKGDAGEAAANISKAVDLDPGSPVMEAKLAWILAAAPQPAVRDGERALQLATRICQAGGAGDPLILRTMAAAYAQTGQYPLAVETAQKALQMADSQGIAELSEALRREIKLYEAGKSYEAL